MDKILLECNVVVEKIATHLKEEFNKSSNFKNKRGERKWETRSWAPFILEIFEKWGESLDFKPKREYLTVDLCWIQHNFEDLDVPLKFPYLYLALEHEESDRPHHVSENCELGPQLDEIRKLGMIKARYKILTCRPKYRGVRKKLEECIQPNVTAIEKEIKNQYLEVKKDKAGIKEEYYVIFIYPDSKKNPSKIVVKGYRYKEKVEGLVECACSELRAKLDKKGNWEIF